MIGTTTPIISRRLLFVRLIAFLVAFYLVARISACQDVCSARGGPEFNSPLRRQCFGTTFLPFQTVFLSLVSSEVVLFFLFRADVLKGRVGVWNTQLEVAYICYCSKHIVLSFVSGLDHVSVGGVDSSMRQLLYL
ncbi:uncharacterized protein YALI1_C08938g [Yarrowia lipolytica]|uniref:Uncharacterized protein n=1 Tax=Yarrowia lipolytica TaxID=4952 RepID=A0A1D8N9Y6_YARLL|nr:hypothetical protein YALI1_C08938g [Yarrowia lipolytica]